jgi:hypothetical protein
MMNRALGPVWHPKQKNQGVMPARLHGVDREATWSRSYADGWVYGHGSFCLVPHQVPVVGLFVWMRNSAYEPHRMEQEIQRYTGLIQTVCMDSKADSLPLLQRLRDQWDIQLVTCLRKNFIKSSQRKAMQRQMQTRANRRIYRERGVTVEPMQGLVKDIFELERCWMRGDVNNRWLFAAMGVAVQIAQGQAIRMGRSTWQVKQQVLGV